jgi:uncharacterized protein (TIGR03435 family)
MRRLATGCVFSALCSGLPGQTPQPAQQPVNLPEFEVAVIKLNVPGGTPSRATTAEELRNGHLRFPNMSMNELFRQAFDVGKGAPIMAGAPAWFETDHWEVVAKAPTDTPDTPADTAARIMRMKLMLQSFLIQELKLVIHTEQRPMSVYALTVAKDGPKFQRTSDTRVPSTCTGAGRPAGYVGGHQTCKNMPMGRFASLLPQWADSYFGDTQVLDQTGLTGTYDFDLDWAYQKTVDVEGGLTVFAAVEKLGLKLKLEKLPMPVMVIDHAERPVQK